MGYDDQYLPVQFKQNDISHKIADDCDTSSSASDSDSFHLVDRRSEDGVPNTPENPTVTMDEKKESNSTHSSVSHELCQYFLVVFSVA